MVETPASSAVSLYPQCSQGCTLLSLSTWLCMCSGSSCREKIKWKAVLIESDSFHGNVQTDTCLVVLEGTPGSSPGNCFFKVVLFHYLTNWLLCGKKTVAASPATSGRVQIRVTVIFHKVLHKMLCYAKDQWAVLPLNERQMLGHKSIRK